MAKRPELFGTGHPEGLVASEISVNGSTGVAMIHLLTLGIPGSAATAVMMGAFLIHGIQPGPLLFNTFIVVFCFLGAYALRNDMADVWLTMLFGIPVRRPVSAAILAIAALMIVWPFVKTWRARRPAARAT